MHARVRVLSCGEKSKKINTNSEINNVPRRRRGNESPSTYLPAVVVLTAVRSGCVGGGGDRGKARAQTADTAIIVLKNITMTEHASRSTGPSAACVSKETKKP